MSRAVSSSQSASAWARSARWRGALGTSTRHRRSSIRRAQPPRPVDLAEKEGCYHALLLVRVEAAVLGGELLCHRFGDDVDVVGHLPVGTSHRPQDLSPLLFDFCLSTSIPALTTSTYVVAWPQGDQFLGGGPWHKANPQDLALVPVGVELGVEAVARVPAKALCRAPWPCGGGPG